MPNSTTDSIYKKMSEPLYTQEPIAVSEPTPNYSLNDQSKRAKADCDTPKRRSRTVASPDFFSISPQEPTGVSMQSTNNSGNSLNNNYPISPESDSDSESDSDLESESNCFIYLGYLQILAALSILCGMVLLTIFFILAQPEVALLSIGVGLTLFCLFCADPNDFVPINVDDITPTTSYFVW